MRNEIGRSAEVAHTEPPRQRRPGWRVLRWVLPVCLLVVWAACSDGPTAPVIGAMRVTIATTGGDRDDNGYVIAIDNDRLEPISGDGAKVLQGLGAGTHSVALENVADNCTVTGSNPRSVTVTPETIAQVDFVVACDATGIAVTTVTSGPDVPPPFQVRIGDLAPTSVLSNGTTVIGRLAPGTYTVALTGIVEGCTLDGAPEVTVSVTHRDVTPVTFAVACLALSGVVRVTLSTSGEDPDPNGYTVATTDGWQSPAAVNGVVIFQPMAAGTHVVRLSGVAANCTVASGSERTVTVTVGGAIRDTVNTAFDVTCARAQKIAFAANGVIVVAYADGSNPVVVASGGQPSWSPDGKRLVYSTLDCYYGYWCSGGLAILDFESRESTPMPNGVGGWDPAWSPDGERIAFVAAESDGSARLAVISVDNDLPPSHPVAPGQLGASNWPSSPSWSPDGQRIVFACTVFNTSTFDICAVNRNGTAFQRLTNGEGTNWDPAWSPDGSRIAFTTSRFGGQFEIALMAPDGNGVTRLIPGSDPSWTPSGQILFTAAGGVHVVNADGSGLTRLFTANNSYDPVWRP
ncbi:hypothetical protein BH23GEM2_BH23GEM2_16530 [soil metagenome]